MKPATHPKKRNNLIEPKHTFRIALIRYGSQMDDNDAILRLLKDKYPFEEAVRARLDLGRERYGHGIRAGDDTTQWGTKTDSWLEMGLEEIDDLAIYVAAHMVREVNQWLNREREAINAVTFFKVIDSLAEARKQIADLMENNG